MILKLRIKYKSKNYFLIGQVDIPKMEYKGQKLIKLVSVKTQAITKSTIPKVSVITLVKNKKNKIAEINNLITRSTDDMFFFIIHLLKLLKID